MSHTAADRDDDTEPVADSEQVADADSVADADEVGDADESDGERPAVEEDLFEEELRIDGICGVY